MSDMVPVGSQHLPAERSLFSPRELVYVAFRRKIWIFAVWLPILALGLFGVLRESASFGASSKVLLELQSPQNPSLDITVRSVDYDLAISTYTHLAMSVPVAEIAAVTLRDSLPVLVQIDPEFARLEQHDKMLEFILTKLDVTRVAESNLLDIRFTSNNERIALMVNRAVRDAFLAYSLGTGRNSRAISYYAEQVKNVESEIDSLLALREEVSNRSGVLNLIQDSNSGLGMRANLSGKYYEVCAEASLKEANIANLREALVENPDFVPSNLSAAHLSAYRERLINETEAYYRLVADHPENSEKVRRQAGVLAGLKSDTRAAVQEYLRSLELEAKGLRAKAAVLQEQMSTVATTLEVIPDAYRKMTMLDAQIVARTELLEGLQIKSGEVRISGMADDRISRLTIITEPEIVTVISGVRKYAIFGALAVIGLALGLLTGFVVERNDHRIYDVRVLSQSVEVPVLGSISATKR